MICQKAQGTIFLLLEMLCPWEAFWIFLAYFHTLFCSRAHAMQWGIFICHQNVLWDILPSSLFLLNFLLLHIAKKKIDYVLSYLHSHLGHIEHLCMSFNNLFFSDWCFLLIENYLVTYIFPIWKDSSWLAELQVFQVVRGATTISAC